MLQQTQVSVVVPYFLRFMEAFPTVHALALAEEQRVLSLWQGLGYYRRARNLHAAAGVVMRQFGGVVPSEVEELMRLPGVGRYTAGAVASIAYGRPAAVLDGNVMRVLARFDGVEEPVDDGAVQKRLWARAEGLVRGLGAGDVEATTVAFTASAARPLAPGPSAPRPLASPGDFNQALMELGATVCLPGARQARCLVCPLRGACAAWERGLVDRLPIKRGKKPAVAVRHVVVAVERDGRYLFEQRGEQGLWSSMWQCPTVENIPRGVAAALRQITQRTGLSLHAPVKLGTFDHATTHRAIRFDIYRTSVASGRLRSGAGLWRTLNQVEDLPMSNPQHAVLKMLGG